MNSRFFRWTPAAILMIAGSTHSLAAGPFGATVELSSLNGANGFVINGIGVNDGSGRSVSSAGDVNGDGIDDLIIGAFRADPNGLNSAGESYVVFGGVGIGASGTIELSSLNGANGFVMNGIGVNDDSGGSVSGAGDVNGDGIDDLIIGAVGAGQNGFVYGASYVVFGGVGVGASGAIELSSLNGTNGFVLNGTHVGDRNGNSVSGAGDVNGDGIDDLIIGAHNASPTVLYSGQSYIVFGAVGIGSSGAFDLESLTGANGFKLNGIDAYDRSGGSVSSAGDVNGDGIGDIIIGAVFANPNGTSSGESYVVFGEAGLGADLGPGGAMNLSSLELIFGNPPGPRGFIIKGINAFDYSGRSVAGAGDINGDGIDDLIIGAPDASRNVQYSDSRGECYVVFGGVGVGVGTFELSSLNGANGFVCYGIDEYDKSGYSVSSAGDINGDGIDDLIIGAYGAHPNALNRAGRSYVIFGGNSVGAGGTLSLVCLADSLGADGDFGFVINGINEYDYSGYSVSGAGDINGDGIDDLIIGAGNANPNGINGAGESYVIFGKTAAAEIPGDINGDGIVDTADLGILLGAFGSSSP